RAESERADGGILAPPGPTPPRALEGAAVRSTPAPAVAPPGPGAPAGAGRGAGPRGGGAPVRETLPFSLALVGTATVVAFAIGTALGLVAAWRRGGAFDGTVTTTTAVVWTVPAFAGAGIALEWLGVTWKLFPFQWAYGLDVVPSWSWAFVASAIRHAELP